MADIFAALRSSCDNCGSRAIEWMTAAQLSQSVDASDLDQALEFCGPDGQAWKCLSCDNYGVFGPLMTDWG